VVPHRCRRHDGAHARPGAERSLNSLALLAGAPIVPPPGSLVARTAVPTAAKLPAELLTVQRELRVDL